jgi:hypothetical protein
LAPEIGRGGSDRRPHYDTNRNAGSGFGQNERQGKGEKESNIIGTKIEVSALCGSQNERNSSTTL